MDNKTKTLLLIIICLLAINVKAQDKILFLNGKSLEGTLLDKTNYEFTFKDQKEKEFVIDKYRVFSYTQNNKESLVYEFDTLSGNFLKVEDMKMFVYGERDAYETYKPQITNYTGLAVGAAAGFMMQKDQSFIYIPTPLIYTALTLLLPTKVNQSKLKDTKYLKEDEYLRGYERVARAKRTQGALKTSLVGMGIGFLIGVIANGNKD
jgi:hypothetical protein